MISRPAVWSLCAALVGAVVVGVMIAWPGPPIDHDQGPRKAPQRTVEEDSTLSKSEGEVANLDDSGRSEITVKEPMLRPKPAAPFSEAKAKVLPMVRSVSEDSRRDLGNTKRKEGDSEIRYLKRLIDAEWRSEKNRLVYEHIRDGKFLLTKVGTPNWDRWPVKGTINLAVDTVSIDGEKWSVRVAISPSRNLYFKKLTDYMLNLTDQVLTEHAREFNSLPKPEREAVQVAIDELSRLKTAYAKAPAGPEKEALLEKMMSAKRQINPKWQHIYIKGGKATAR